MYNENDQGAAAWLRQLVAYGHIHKGEVDERSIKELKPEDCPETSHFFAGIGGWSYALKLIGWPDIPIWTGSCPCQPFSKAGRNSGIGDERHLWPTWLALIAKCKPSILFGEQVASELGKSWFSVVRSDLESLGYAVGCADLSAAGVGAPHRRQRLFFGATRLAETSETRRLWNASRLGNTDLPRPQGRPSAPSDTGQRAPWAAGMAGWIACTDGVGRPFEPGSCPLVDGVPARVVRIRGYGNAIVPQVAATFIESFMEAI